MLNEFLLDHFQNPRNAGELAEPRMLVEVANPACGDLLRLTVRFEGSRVGQVRFQVRGCSASIAAGSALSEWMRGRERAELEALDAEALEHLLGGLPAHSRHAAVLCVDALKALLRA